jgi:ribosomal protein S17E
VNTQSKILRNTIAGYLTRLVILSRPETTLGTEGIKQQAPA